MEIIILLVWLYFIGALWWLFLTCLILNYASKRRLPEFLKFRDEYPMHKHLIYTLMTCLIWPIPMMIGVKRGK